MSERAKAFWLGVFILAATALAAWLLLFLKPSPGDEGQTLHVRFTNVDKISVGTQVTLAGKLVGEVDAIHIVQDARNGPSDNSGNLYFYELTLAVDSSVHIYTYDLITYATIGLLGEKSVAILPKSPPPGAPPAQEVSQKILYGRSADKLEEAVQTVSNVAENLEETLQKFTSFLVCNQEEFHDALISVRSAASELTEFVDLANQQKLTLKLSHAAVNLSNAMEKADLFFGEAINTQLVEKFNQALHSIALIAHELSAGQGTLGRLLKDDSLFHQLNQTMYKFDTVLDDIHRYGLLFQYNKKWQRQQRQNFYLSPPIEQIP